MTDAMLETTGSESPVTDLADRFWQWFLSRQPIYATALGDERYDDRLPDPSAEARAEEETDLRGFLRDARELEHEQMGRRTDHAGHARGGRPHLAAPARPQLYHFDAIDQNCGPQNLPGDLARFQRVDTTDRVDRLVRRLEQFPEHLEKHRVNLLEGVAGGRAAAQPAVVRVIEQTRRAVETPPASRRCCSRIPSLSDGARGRIAAAVKKHVSRRSPTTSPH